MGRVRAAVCQSSPVLDVAYGVDVVEASVKSFMEEFQCEGLVLSDDSLKKVLSDDSVNAVIVATTSSSHRDLVIASLNAGKHVFCEKPLALSAKDVEECVALAKEKGLALYCGFQRRTDRNFSRLKDAIKGNPELIRITSREPASNSDISYLLSSGGFLFDSLIHDFDMAMFLANNEVPVEVFCSGTAFNPKLREAGDVDAVVVVLRFASGIIASIDNHRNACYGYDQRAEVHTREGAFFVENVFENTVMRAGATGHVRQNPPAGLQRYEEAYRADIVHFSNLLLGIESVPLSAAEDCVWTARIAAAANKSLKSGKPVLLREPRLAGSKRPASDAL